MAGILSLRETVRRFVYNGDSVAFEGSTHLIPTVADHELIRQGRKDLTPICMTSDLVHDLLIGADRVKKLVLPRGGSSGVGSLHRLYDAVKKGWLQPLEIEERGHADLASAYIVGASGLPSAMLHTYVGPDLSKVNPLIRGATCPFTGGVLAAVSSVRPGVSVIHMQKIDHKGDVLLWGILGVQKEAALATKRYIVTVEEIADELDASMNTCALPSWALGTVCLVPGSVHPSYTHGYYERDNRFYQDWDPIARDHESSTTWIGEYIRGTGDFGVFQAKLAEGKQ